MSKIDYQALREAAEQATQDEWVAYILPGHNGIYPARTSEGRHCADNQWKGDDDYLKWLDQCLAQFWRVLKPAGSLYLFCGHRLASDIEIMMRERFSVLNHIIWAKPSGRWNGCNKESLRAYFPATERILFAEHYQGPYRPKDAGYAAKGSALKQHVMAPLISYFRDARA
ncbi:ead/Ea22-like family protein, partial [Escherichia coli]